MAGSEWAHSTTQEVSIPSYSGENPIRGAKMSDPRNMDRREFMQPCTLATAALGISLRIAVSKAAGICGRFAEISADRGGILHEG